MARRNTRTKKKVASVDFSNVGKQFEAEEQYELIVAVCTLEEGNEHPYFAFQFKGADEDYEDSIMYHNASTSPQSLWRLRPLIEAMGIEIPDGPFDLDPEDFIGKHVMASTILEKREGGKSAIRPDEFWAVEEADEPKGKKAAGKGKSSKKKDEAEMPDLDTFSDDDIKALAKELGVKGRKVDQLKEEISELEAEDVVAAIEELGLEPEEEEEEKKTRGRRGSKAKDEEDDEPKGKSSRSSRGSAKSKKKPEVTEDAVNDMSEDELEELNEEHDLGVDLDEHRTLRKKKAAIIDALQEAGIIE